MKLFSEREGLKPNKLEIQDNNINKTLRLKLWNLMYLAFFKGVGDTLLEYSEHDLVFSKVWETFFQKSADELPRNMKSVKLQIKDFIHNATWFKVYDLIELVPSLMSETHNRNKNFLSNCNNILESELSAWRFIGFNLCKISSEEELQTIEEALVTAENLHTVKTHLKQSVQHLSDRQNPDYRNSIKESISAVEAIFKMIVYKDSITLGAAIKEIEKQGKIELNTAFKKILTSIWAYSSNSDGIRHALKPGETSNLTYEESKFLLVTCSALVNYLSVKANKAGIVLQ